MSWDGILFQRHLNTRRFGREFLWLDEIDSTNRWLAENTARFTMSGALVVANHQTAGRGRYQRAWHDVPGTSLLFSVMLRIHEQGHGTGFIGMLPAIAIAELLRGSLKLGKRVRLKWPNDVMVSDRKVAGILGQRVMVGNQSLAVVGVGMNVSVLPSDFPDDVREQATSIAAEIGEFSQREVLLAAILARWEELHDALLDGQIEMIRAAWEQLGPERGAMIARRENDAVFTGHFAGLGGDGQLRLADETGAIHEFHSGDTGA
jgi:BirA family transcriptional regulator, biotin operon repressor / biotin---[acetyl-CoA-carboxylase] ligase